MSEKAEYSTPSLTVYGSAEQLTRESNKDNSDDPGGTPGTAFSPVAEE